MYLYLFRELCLRIGMFLCVFIVWFVFSMFLSLFDVSLLSFLMGKGFWWQRERKHNQTTIIKLLFFKSINRKKQTVGLHDELAWWISIWQRLNGKMKEKTKHKQQQSNKNFNTIRPWVFIYAWKKTLQRRRQIPCRLNINRKRPKQNEKQPFIQTG